MDLREKKTKRSIQNAFLQLRAHKPLERITVKELAELAEISKGTFYLHYKDIYDLSEQLQNGVIEKILDTITRPELILSAPAQFTKELYAAFYAHQSLIDILFRGTQASVLPLQIEKKIREYIDRLVPQAREQARLSILLSYQIQGGYYAYADNHKRFGTECVLEVLSETAEKLSLNTEMPT